MTSLGHLLQVTGLVVAPLGMIHFFSTREYVSESSLMTWELGCLFFGALCFLLGKRLSGPGDASP